MFSRSLLVNCAVAFVLAGSGWAQMQPPGGAPQPPTGPPAGNPPGISNDPGNAPQTDPYAGDKDFVKTIAESSATEAQLGKIAQEKASSDGVKEFGKQMVEAQSQTGQELQQAATALKIDLTSGPPRKAKKDEEKLAKLSGADFDHAYTKMAADEQKQAVKQFEREAKEGKSPALKEYAAKKLAAEQEREKQAEALTTGGTATAKPAGGK
jgi:putative membrane protein